MDARRWRPITRGTFANLMYTHYCESSKGLEGDHKVHTRNCSFKKKYFYQNSASNLETGL